MTDEMMENSQRKRSGASDIATQLKREIAKGIRLKNERLPSERVLAEDYGVARNTIREALTKLEIDDYVKTRRGSGTYVVYEPPEASANAIENAGPLELIDARFALEPHICRLNVLHGKKSDFDQLEKLCEEMEAAVGDHAAFAEADAEFHRLLAEASGNSLLIWVIGQINSVRSRDEWTRMTRVTLDEKIISQYNTEHRQILNAIRTREPERAASLMKEHLETARLSLTRAAQA